MADAIPSEVRSLSLALHTDLTTINAYASKSPRVVLALLIEAEKKMLTISRYIGETRTAALDMQKAQAAADLGLAPLGWDAIEAGTDQA